MTSFFRRLNMTSYQTHFAIGLVLAALFLGASACKDKETVANPKDLPDLNSQTFSYVTIEATKVRTGPGTQFRAITEIGPNARVNVVGRDGEWVLIVSKKGNAPGFIELAAVKPSDGESKEALDPRADGKYEAVAATQVRSGPGLHYPVVAKIPKGTKLNVVNEENGWLKVESKRGNEPGYVEANFAKPVGE
jgi:N-acetylmuramoyl-L-alanine amidase